MKKMYKNLRLDIMDLSEEILDLLVFMRHLENTVNQYCDESYPTDGRFDLKIELNGKQIVMPLHADLYSNLYAFLRSVLEEEVEENAPCK